jgi:hypothetical protein
MRNFILYCSVSFIMLIGLLPLGFLTSVIPNPYANIMAGEIGLLGGVIAAAITDSIEGMLR